MNCESLHRYSSLTVDSCDCDRRFGIVAGRFVFCQLLLKIFIVYYGFWIRKCSFGETSRFGYGLL